MLWFKVLGILLLLGLGLCFLRLSIRLRYGKNTNECLWMTFGIFAGFIRYTAKFPIKGGEGKKEKASSQKSKKEPGPQDKKKRKVREYPSLQRLLNIGGTFLQINKRLLRHVRLSRLFWNTRVGFEDAALTGMAGGILWGIKGLLLSFLERNLDTNKFRAQIKVTPVFCEQEIATEVDCIFDLRVGYIIIAGFRLILLGIISYPVLKGVRLHERPSN